MASSGTRIRSGRVVCLVVCCAMSLGALFASGCSGGSPKGAASGASGATSAAGTSGKGYGMGGVDQTIAIQRSTLDNKPAPWDLSTPQSAVRSYLGWASYAYRIGESDVATPTMSAGQLIRFDAYNQMNLQKQRLIDETLKSITFEGQSAEGTHTLLHAKEDWSYRYVSIKEAGKTLEGPYAASYETTYTVVKTPLGWVVDNIAVKALGTIK